MVAGGPAIQVVMREAYCAPAAPAAMQVACPAIACRSVKFCRSVWLKAVKPLRSFGW